MKRLVILFLFFNIMIVDAANTVNVSLNSCIDGDTAKFNIKNEIKTVRFLSIDAPEIEHGEVQAEPFGNEASDYTCSALKSAKVIKLQYDPKSDKVDKYDRVLAWVFVDEKLLQEDLVKNGLAEVKYVYDDYLYSSKLQSLEVTAKNKRLGMWSSLSFDSFDFDFEFLVGCFVILAVLFKVIFSKRLNK